MSSMEVLFECELPGKVPSVNSSYFRRKDSRVFMVKEAKEWKQKAINIQRALLKDHKNKDVFPLDKTLSVSVELGMTNHKRRDIDNALKAVLDTLQEAGVIVNDSLIVAIHAIKYFCQQEKTVVRVEYDDLDL